MRVLLGMKQILEILIKPDTGRIFGIVAIAIASVISFQQSRDSLEKAAFDQLTSVREMKAFQIENYLEFIANQVVTFSADRMVIDTCAS